MVDDQPHSHYQGKGEKRNLETTNPASLSKQHICISTFCCIHMSDMIRVVLELDRSSRISFILRTHENICLHLEIGLWECFSAYSKRCGTGMASDRSLCAENWVKNLKFSQLFIDSQNWWTYYMWMSTVKNIESIANGYTERTQAFSGLYRSSQIVFIGSILRQWVCFVKNVTSNFFLVYLDSIDVVDQNRVHNSLRTECVELWACKICFKSYNILT